MAVRQCNQPVARRRKDVSNKLPNVKHVHFAHERFQEFLQHHAIVLPKQHLSLDALRVRALKRWRRRNNVTIDACMCMSQEFVDWITVSWIRHQCCDYDRTLRWFQASMRQEMHTMLKLYVLNMIKHSHPQLAKACEQQAHSSR